jgi:hypothetical protein
VVAASPRPSDDAHRDLGLLHHALAVLFAIGRVAAAGARHVHVVQPHVDALHVQVVDARVADRRQDAPRFGSTRRTRS